MAETALLFLRGQSVKILAQVLEPLPLFQVLVQAFGDLAQAVN